MSKWIIVGGVLLASCTADAPSDDAGSSADRDAAPTDGNVGVQDGSAIVQDAAIDDAGMALPPAPGTWQGRMTGEVGGYPFEAALTLTVGASLQVTGHWVGNGRFASWNGGVSGIAIQGDFHCDVLSAPQNALCVSMDEPESIQVPGILKGALTASGGSGRWFFSVFDVFQDGGVGFMGEGTWQVE